MTLSCLFLYVDLIYSFYSAKLEPTANAKYVLENLSPAD